MNQEVKKFYDAMANDEALRLRASEVNKKFVDKKPGEDEAAEAIVAFAAEQGYSFTKGDLEAYGESTKNEAMQALPESELAAIVGGAGVEVQSVGCTRCFVPEQCFCAVGGGGQHHDPDFHCVCIAFGIGGLCGNRKRLMCPYAGWVWYW